MRKLAYGLLALACTAVLAASVAMALGTRSAEGGGDHHGPPVSKDVRHMLRDISARNIEHSITTLASFGSVMPATATCSRWRASSGSSAS